MPDRQFIDRLVDAWTGLVALGHQLGPAEWDARCADDGCVGAGVAAGALQHLAEGSAVRILDGVGRFLHLEGPSRVNRLILDFADG